MDKKAIIDFIKTKKSVLLLLGTAIVSSTLYAISLQQGHNLNLSYVEQYVKESHLHNHLDLKTAVWIFIAYFKKYAFIWLAGILPFLWPIAIGLAFCDIFSYGFSVSAVYLSFGGKGILMGLSLFIIQGIILTFLLLDLTESILKKNNIFNFLDEHVYAPYYYYLVKGGLGCLFITFIEIVLIVLF